MARINNPPPQEYKYPMLNGGMCIEDYEHKIQPNQSPDMLNMWFRDRALSKRPGQINLGDPVGAFDIIQVYRRDYKGFRIFHADTKLYKLNLDTGATTQIHTGLSTKKGTFFVYGDILYYLGGGKLTQWNGTTAANVTPYIPNVILGRSPSGGGTPDQPYNRIGAGFKNSFSGTVADTVYKLTQTGLDVTLVTATVNGAAKVETTDFTVNRTTGEVTFTVAPGEGTNNVVITAYKTDSELIGSILNCCYAEFFGAADNYLFVSGNSDFANYYFYSELLTVSGAVDYFPDTNYNLLGNSDNAISGFGKQYGVLIVLRETAISRVLYDEEAVNKFPVKEVNSSIGCDMPWTIQLIDNHLVFANTYAGVHLLASTALEDERNVKQISRNINGTPARLGLLSLSNLKAAASYDFFDHYILCVGDKIYAWNYAVSPYVDFGNNDESQRRLAWFPWDNIPANCFFDDGESLYYGSRSTGQYVKFTLTQNDNGESINGYWESKLNDFGLADWLKYIIFMWATVIIKSNNTMSVNYVTDDGQVYMTTTDNITFSDASFDWDNWDWDIFGWKVLVAPKTIRKKPKLKNIVYFKVKFSNSTVDEDLILSDLNIQFNLIKRVK